MTRHINAAGRTLLELDEQGPGGGPALVAYLCPADKWTIGWGHTAGVQKGDCCTLPEAVALLDGDIGWAEREVETHVTAPLNDNQFSALVCWTFNIGRYGFDTSTALRELNAHDYADVPAQMARWNKMHDPKTGALVVSPGLTRRRAQEITIWNAADSQVAGSV